MTLSRALIFALVGFTAIELALLIVSSDRLNWAVAAATMRDPLVWMMLVDFSFVVGVVFAWMHVDAKNRGRSAWPWVPGLIAVPTAALLLFLLQRERDLAQRSSR